MSDIGRIIYCHACQTKAKYLVDGGIYTCGNHLTYFINVNAPLSDNQVKVELLTKD